MVLTSELGGVWSERRRCNGGGDPGRAVAAAHCDREQISSLTLCLGRAGWEQSVEPRPRKQLSQGHDPTGQRRGCVSPGYPTLIPC